MENKDVKKIQEGLVLYEVWDSLTRLLHWINVFAIFSMFILGGILYYRVRLGLSDPTVDSIVSIHVYFGYILIAGLIIRWIWLYTGPPLSTWKDIIPHTKGQIETLKDTIRFYLNGFRGNPPFYVAHNPLAGLAYMTFFVVGAIQAIVGLVLNQVPPLPSGERKPPQLLISSHDIGFYIILIYVFSHFFALVVHELSENRSIISSMIHGKKIFRKDEIERVEDYINSLKES